ncbi:MAG: GGDEF domain-containing protein [Roseburia sp.]
MGTKGYDQEVSGWLDEVQKSRGADPDTTLIYCNKIEEYAREQKDEWLLGYAFYHSGEVYYLRNDLEQMFHSMFRSLSYLEHTGQYGLLVRGYNILAITAMNQGNAPFALDYYLKGLNYCEKYDLFDVGIMIRINIGTMYNNCGEYAQAAHYLEESYTLLQQYREIAEYYNALMSIYIGMINSCIYRQQLDRAIDYMSRIRSECGDYMQEEDRLVYACSQARIFQLQGKSRQRDEAISNVHELICQQMPLLDIFDDLYEYCLMLLGLERYQELRYILEQLETMARNADSGNMQKRILTLKARGFLKEGDEEGYRQITVHLFELEEALEKESRRMVLHMLSVRRELEESQRYRRRMEQENRKLLERSQTDPLTGLANRFHLNSYVEEKFATARENVEPFGVEILDIDYFKQYNDNYGHQAGDSCIRAIARILQKMEETGKIFCARYGGDEFIVIYEACSRSDVERLTRELKQEIEDLSMKHEFSQAASIVTISQGICFDIPGPEQKAEDFLRAADQMLYRVKEQSRNSILIGGCKGDV